MGSRDFFRVFPRILRIQSIFFPTEFFSHQQSFPIKPPWYSNGIFFGRSSLHPFSNGGRAGNFLSCRGPGPWGESSQPELLSCQPNWLRMPPPPGLSGNTVWPPRRSWLDQKIFSVRGDNTKEWQFWGILISTSNFGLKIQPNCIWAFFFRNQDSQLVHSPNDSKNVQPLRFLMFKFEYVYRRWFSKDPRGSIRLAGKRWWLETKCWLDPPRAGGFEKLEAPQGNKFCWQVSRSKQSILFPPQVMECECQNIFHICSHRISRVSSGP